MGVQCRLLHRPTYWATLRSSYQSGNTPLHHSVSHLLKKWYLHCLWETSVWSPPHVPTSFSLALTHPTNRRSAQGFQQQLNTLNFNLDPFPTPRSFFFGGGGGGSTAAFPFRGSELMRVNAH